MFPEANPRETLRSRGNKNALFSVGAVIRCFVTPRDSKIERKLRKKVICLTPLHTLAALANLSGCQNQPALSKNHDNSLFLRS